MQLEPISLVKGYANGNTEKDRAIIYIIKKAGRGVGCFWANYVKLQSTYRTKRYC